MLGFPILFPRKDKENEGVKMSGEITGWLDRE